LLSSCIIIKQDYDSFTRSYVNHLTILYDNNIELIKIITTIKNKKKNKRYKNENIFYFLYFIKNRELNIYNTHSRYS